MYEYCLVVHRAQVNWQKVRSRIRRGLAFFTKKKTRRRIRHDKHIPCLLCGAQLVARTKEIDFDPNDSSKLHLSSEIECLKGDRLSQNGDFPINHHCIYNMDFIQSETISQLWDTLSPSSDGVGRSGTDQIQNQSILYVLHVAHNGVHIEWIYNIELLAESFLL